MSLNVGGAERERQSIGFLVLLPEMLVKPQQATRSEANPAAFGAEASMP